MKIFYLGKFKNEENDVAYYYRFDFGIPEPLENLKGEFFGMDRRELYITQLIKSFQSALISAIYSDNIERKNLNLIDFL